MTRVYALIAALVVVIVAAGAAYYIVARSQPSSVEEASPTQTAPTTAAPEAQTTAAQAASSPAQLARTVHVGTLRGGVSSVDIILAKGLDEKEGFKVELLLFSRTLDLANAIAHGDVDVAIIPAEFVAKLREQGNDIVIVAVDFYQNQAVVVRGNVTADSIEQLKGARLAAFKPTGTYAMFKAYMETLYGADPETFFKLVDAPPPQIVQAFERGDVDAAVIWEPFVSKLVADSGGRILVSYQELWQSWSGHVGDNGVMIVYAARGDWVRSNAGLLERLLKARSEAAKLWNTDKDLALKVLTENYGLSKRAAELCWQRLKMEEAVGITESLERNIEAVWQLAHLGGYISSDPQSLIEGAFWKAGS